MIEVVAALLREKERFLLCQRPEHKARALGWEFPGGKLEKGETPAQALIREMREELDCDIAAQGVAAETVYAYPDVTVHLMLLEACLAEGGKSPRLLEHRALAWVTPEEAKGYALCPADRQLLEQLAE